ncbi:MAG: NYN domain-containing protein [Candidatus Staskawiczbacteria bacterium]|nr:NYN domain-containing protein [Candidatus Staskawiczbacteria bacterium]
MRTFVFIDASNLFYGGEKSLGWKIDYQKLLNYLKEKYGISRALYFGGAEIYDFNYNYLLQDTVPIEDVARHLLDKIKNKSDKLDDVKLILINRHLKRIKFYSKLKSFGYELHLKPVKLYYDYDEDQQMLVSKRKANCDVDMTFYLMKEMDNFDKIIVLSGDGDFLPVLKYLREQKKEVVVLARGPRTAREIRQFAGSNFRDFEYLKYMLKMEDKKK